MSLLCNVVKTVSATGGRAFLGNRRLVKNLKLCLVKRPEEEEFKG